jgi:hypothetical protein
MKYLDIKIHIYGMFLIILHSIITLIYSLGGSTFINKYINSNIIIIYSIVIGCIGLYFIRDRNVYLPFLDEMVMPCSLLKKTTPTKTTVSKSINVPPNSTVIYWASEPSTTTELTTPDIAYGNYKNAGITKSDSNGNVILKVRQPQAYKVKKTFRTKILQPHIHYRYCKNDGFISQLETVVL